jgi:hypothetical protein
MPALESSPLNFAAGLLLGAALLWLGPEIAVAARVRSALLGRLLRGVALLLVASGLWWPGHLMSGGDSFIAAHPAMPLLGWALALGLAWCARTTAAAASRQTLPTFAVLSLCTLLAAYGHTMITTPSLFGAARMAGAGLPGLAIFGIASSLVLLSRLDAGPRRRGSRLAAALLCASLLALAAGASPAPPEAGPGQLVLMAACVLLAGVLLATLVQLVIHGAEIARQRVAPTPSVDSLTQLPTRV